MTNEHFFDLSKLPTSMPSLAQSLQPEQLQAFTQNLTEATKEAQGLIQDMMMAS